MRYTQLTKALMLHELIRRFSFFIHSLTLFCAVLGWLYLPLSDSLGVD